MASELEKQMAELMAGAGAVSDGVKDAQKTASKVRRRSRDLEQQFGDMPSLKKWNGLVSLLGEKTDSESITELFVSIDEDKSESIEKGELVAKFKAIAAAEGKALMDDVVKGDIDQMFADALANKLIADGEKITLPEFIKMIEHAIAEKAKAK